MKRVSFLSFALSLAASQAWAFDCDAPKGAIAQTICEDQSLRAKNWELGQLIEDWRLGPNAEFVAEFDGSPPDFSVLFLEPDAQVLTDRACEKGQENADCIHAEFDHYITRYSGLIEEKVGIEYEGKKHSGLLAFGARTRNLIYTDDALMGTGFEPFTWEYMEAFVDQQYDGPEVENCPSCRLETYHQSTLRFEDEKLIFAEVFNSAYSGGAQPLSSFRPSIYDLNSEKDIGFTGLFKDDDWQTVRDDLIDQIILELNQLERARQERDGDKQVLYFSNIKELLEDLPKEDWNNIAFTPDVASDKIIGFRILASDFQFAPHAYTDYYDDLTIAMSETLLDKLKDEYKDSFFSLL